MVVIARLSGRANGLDPEPVAKCGDGPVLPSELARQHLDLATAGKDEAFQVLVEEPFIAGRPGCAVPAERTSLDAGGDGRPLGAALDLALDQIEMNARLPAGGFHARQQHEVVRRGHGTDSRRRIRPAPEAGHSGNGVSSGL